MGCPYEGEVNPNRVLEISKRLLNMGCYEVSLGDTIGIGNEEKTEILMNTLLSDIPVNKLAVHFHNTYGNALENILIALKHGIEVIDCSIGGLGGCPYAK